MLSNIVCEWGKTEYIEVKVKEHEAESKVFEGKSSMIPEYWQQKMNL